MVMPRSSGVSFEGEGFRRSDDAPDEWSYHEVVGNVRDGAQTDPPNAKKEALRLPKLLILNGKCSKEDSNLHRLPY